jgi:hypothetical protein
MLCCQLVRGYETTHSRCINVAIYHDITERIGVDNTLSRPRPLPPKSVSNLSLINHPTIKRYTFWSCLVARLTLHPEDGASKCLGKFC